jgi:DNA-binding LytR/AlgR family response regulator
MLEKISGVEVAGEAGDAEEARALIAGLAPDLIMLDIHMPDESGIELLSSSPDLPPIIFTTAHSEHAVKAFELAAVDYLLKPIEAARLAVAIERVKARTAAPRATSAEERVRIFAKSGATVRIFDAAEIARFVATDKYVVFRAGGEEMLLDESLNALEERLRGLSFLRVHRSELINLNRARALHSVEGETELELENGERAKVSRRYLAELKARLGLSSA